MAFSLKDSNCIIPMFQYFSSFYFDALDPCQFFLTRSVVFQIRLLSTWGDPYYAGLNGIEFYDEYGAKILLDENSIFSNEQRFLITYYSLNATYDLEHMFPRHK